MRGIIKSSYGEIQIDRDVIAKYAGACACECFGIVGMAAINTKDGIVKLLKKESLVNGVNVSIEENELTIDFHVIVAYGVSISSVAANLVSNVRYKLESLTGMKVKKINVLVEGVRVID